MTTSALMDLLKKKKQAIKARSGQKEKTVGLQVGKSRVRILPSWRGEGDAQFFHDFGRHWIKDGEGKVKAVVVCKKHTYGQDCVFCDMIEQGIESATDDQQIKMLSDAKANGRVLVNALMRDSDQPNTPVILELPPSVFADIIDAYEENSIEDEPDFNPLTDPERGIDLVIERTGKGRQDTKYTVTVGAAAKTKPVAKSVLLQLHNLDEYVQEAEEEQQRALKAMSRTMGLLPTGAAAMLTAPKATAEEADYSEDVPAYSVGADDETLSAELDEALDGDSIPEPAVIAKTAATPAPAKAMSDEELGADLSQADIDAMLADLE